jgi:hypothetical protein
MRYGEVGSINFESAQHLNRSGFFLHVELVGFRSVALSTCTPLFVLLGASKLTVERSRGELPMVWRASRLSRAEYLDNYNKAFKFILEVGMQVVHTTCDLREFSNGELPFDRIDEYPALAFNATSKDLLVVEMEEARKEAHQWQQTFAELAKVMHGMRKR